MSYASTPETYGAKGTRIPDPLNAIEVRNSLFSC